MTVRETGPFAVSVAGVLVIVAVVLVRSMRRAGNVRDRCRRGARVRRAVGRPQLWPRRSCGHEVRVGGVRLGIGDETKHFKILGTTGTGKTTAIRTILATALARGDRVVVADPDGCYGRSFHDAARGDRMLNPFEPGSARWDIYAEMREPYDADQLASSLIASGDEGSAREWRGYARTFLAAVLRRSAHLAGRSLGHLWDTVAVVPAGELRPLLVDTPAQPFLDPDNARMFGSIRSVAVSAMSALEHMRTQQGDPLSIRSWINQGRGALFLPYRAGQIAALRGVIATWVRLAIFEAMHGDEGDQRLWFVVDELDALGAIDGLKDALARLRKFGGRCVLGFQSIAQVSSCYGPGDAQTIVENCGNTLILRCSGSEHGGTSHFASRLIGEREMVRHQVARARDRDVSTAWRNSRRSTTVSEQHIVETAVLPAEIEQLRDLHGYLKVVSRPEWQLIRLRN